MKTKLITVCCIVAISISIWQISAYFLSYKAEEKITSEVQQQKQDLSYEGLSKQYKDMKAWIHIEDTKIDYPVMQSSNNEFYLSHDYKGNRLRSGSIFIDYRNTPDFTDRHTILYGHDMRNESMFGQLSNYADETFADLHPYIELIVGNEKLVLQVVYAYNTTTDFYYIETQFTDETYHDFLSQIKQKTLIHENIALNTTDQLVTLSTCESDASNEKRFVVHAKLIERNDL